MVKIKFIKNLRKKHEFSQGYVAGKLNISRPTYAEIEKGERELTLTEAKKLSDIYNITFDELLIGRVAKRKVKRVTTRKKVEKQDIEIRVEEKSIDKFKEALLYILEKVGAKPNVGESVIYKLLYFIDFDYYERFEENLIGATYIKNHYGPTPVEFKDIITEMQENEEIEKVKSKYFQYEQKKYLPRREPNLKIFNAQELSHIDHVLERLSDKSGRELRDYSHGDIPWKSAEEGKKIDYESVFYRDDKYSVKEYRDEL